MIYETNILTFLFIFTRFKIRNIIAIIHNIFKFVFNFYHIFIRLLRFSYIGKQFLKN